jgi:hypothetical protein
MAEGLILMAELAAFGLLLWNVRKLDGKSPKKSLGIFDMKASDEIQPTAKIKSKARGPHA